MSRSSSKGCGRSRSSASTPMVPRARRPRISIRSGMARDAIGRSSAGRFQFRGDGDEAAPERIELAAGDALDDGDGLRAAGHHAGPADVAADESGHPVADLLTVQQDLGALGHQPAQLRVELAQHDARVVGGAEGAVEVGDAQLLVIVEVVGRRDDRNHQAEALLPDPDDLLLAADPAMVGAIAARPLADGQVVLDDPREVPGLDALGPLPLHAADHDASSSSAARTVGATSWTRTIRTPRLMAHV